MAQDDKHLHVGVEIFERLKAHCARRGVFLQEGAEQAIAAWLEQEEAGIAIGSEALRRFVAYCRECGLSPQAALDQAAEDVMRRVRKSQLEVLPKGHQKPEPWSLPPFWLQGEGRA